MNYTVSREQLKFKMEELIQLYLVLNTMGYHFKICTISYDDVLNSIQFYQICDSTKAAYFVTRWTITLPPPTGPPNIGLPVIFKFSLNFIPTFLYAVCMHIMYMP
jgi:hypothetical protein